MTPLPMRPLADNCITAVDSLSRGNFRGFRAGCSPCVLGVLSGVGVLRLYARAAVPGGPFPAAADATPRSLPRMGKGGGMGRSPRSPARCAEAAPWPPRGEAVRGG